MPNIITSRFFGQQLRSGHWSTEGLVFYWRGIPAGNVVDESFYGNDGTITGATWVGDGLDFAVASGNDVIIPNFSFPNDTGDLTLIFDVNPRTDGEADNGYWIMATDFAMYLLWNINGLEINRTDTGDNGRWRTGNDLGLIGSRNTLVITHTGTALPRIYINGIFEETLPEILTPTGTADTIHNTTMMLGSNPGNSRDWDGTMYRVSVYNRVLSASEILDLEINPDLPMQEDPVWWGQAVSAITIPRMIHHYKQAGGL